MASKNDGDEEAALPNPANMAFSTVHELVFALKQVVDEDYSEVVHRKGDSSETVNV